MKIISRTEFMRMPPGTVFAKYVPCAFDHLSIKGDTMGDDFYAVEHIASCTDSNSTAHMMSALDLSQQTGESVAMDFNTETRDGMYDDAQLFAVFERQDVEALIHRLQTCLLPVPS